MLLFAVIQHIEKVQADSLRQADGLRVRERKNAQVLVGHKVDGGGRALEKRAAMADFGVALDFLSNIPAKSVIAVARTLVGFRRISSNTADLRFASLDERALRR